MRYFDWLISKITPDGYSRKCYQKLLSTLYETPFVSIIEHDENRLEEGLSLRKLYFTETGDKEDLRKPCSVLEVLIALAIRWDDDFLYDPDEGDRVDIWFWEMIENLGLTSQDDYSFNEDKVRKIIDVFLRREYRKNGEGGAFPVDSFSGDMRKVELWSQLNSYILENFNF